MGAPWVPRPKRIYVNHCYMRIISPFRDYYDTAQSFGQDDRVIYHRVERDEPFEFNAQNEELAKWFPARNVPWNRRGQFADVSYSYFSDFYRAYYSFFRVGFCGKLYSGVKIQFGEDINSESFYTIDNILARAEKIYKPNKFEKFKVSKFLSTVKEWLAFDEKAPHENFNDWAAKNKVPIMLWTSGNDLFERKTLIYNPCLRNIEFYKVMYPYQAYQELDMYISGVIGYPGVPMIEIEDKYKIAEHGFDKWSFRKIGAKSKV